MKIEEMSENDQAQLHAVLAATQVIDGISPNIDILEESVNPLEIVRYAYLRTCRIYSIEPQQEILGHDLAAKERVNGGLFAHLDEEFNPDEV